MIRDTRFLITVDPQDKELYILHREYPRCLIYVEQKNPVNFVVLDLFEDDLTKDEAIAELTKPEFKQAVHEFWSEQATNTLNFN